MRRLFFVCIALTAVSGCAAIEDYHYCFVQHRRAASAWKACYSRAERHTYSADYEDGWKRGYYDVSTGSSGEPPAIPPPKYWAAKYQSEAGQNVIQEWFDGYQDGATDAQTNGSGAFHTIPTGPTIPTEPLHWISGETEVDTEYIPTPESKPLASAAQYFLQPFQPVATWPAFTQPEVYLSQDVTEQLEPNILLETTAEPVMSMAIEPQEAPAMAHEELPVAIPQEVPQVVQQVVPQVVQQPTPAVLPQHQTAIKPQEVAVTKPVLAPAPRPQPVPSAESHVAPAVKTSAAPAVQTQGAPEVRNPAAPAVRPQAVPAVRPQAVPAVRPQVVPAVPATAPTSIEEEYPVPPVITEE